ncbi:hypothetical protein M430DRAFT_250696 [Amorphotheca resinae ATCC 22711]|uniref:Uncharacterized protein n=1 Tax=Amorphotheca resinae ATCC 22711 TaxID=857342 RepID=A0A2T3B0M3_AMORE|nr:hypothetical protein M430DRAFT_250696 [Amorphotheca resinae ATCC 22711]PSS16959.1 hypothetical protein M430DRAFT_250696 [Amorphotheca resinae ATCC 22711]
MNICCFVYSALFAISRSTILSPLPVLPESPLIRQSESRYSSPSIPVVCFTSRHQRPRGLQGTHVDRRGRADPPRLKLQQLASAGACAGDHARTVRYHYTNVLSAGYEWRPLLRPTVCSAWG